MYWIHTSHTGRRSELAKRPPNMIIGVVSAGAMAVAVCWLEAMAEIQKPIPMAFYETRSTARVVSRNLIIPTTQKTMRTWTRGAKMEAGNSTTCFERK